MNMCVHEHVCIPSFYPAFIFILCFNQFLIIAIFILTLYVDKVRIINTPLKLKTYIMLALVQDMAKYSQEAK